METLFFTADENFRHTKKKSKYFLKYNGTKYEFSAKNVKKHLGKEGL